jgi:hypothetical protein
MRVNFFGVVNVTNTVLPHMRNCREGLIVFIGSRSVFRSQTIVSTTRTFSFVISFANLNDIRASVCNLFLPIGSCNRLTLPCGPQDHTQRRKLLSTVSLSLLA